MKQTWVLVGLVRSVH